jgi:predicted nucleotidyltransferase component of viral defense system
MLTRRSINLVLFALLVLARVAVGCKPPTLKPARLTDEQVNQIAENILEAINSGDYVAFSKDFYDVMTKASTETEYNKHLSLLLKSNGRYISKGKPTLSNIQTIYD